MFGDALTVVAAGVVALATTVSAVDVCRCRMIEQCQVINAHEFEPGHEAHGNHDHEHRCFFVCELEADGYLYNIKGDTPDVDTDIDAYDSRSHDLKQIKPSAQRHTDRYGVLEKCTWSENVARQLSLPERPHFTNFLRSKGIDLK